MRNLRVVPLGAVALAAMAVSVACGDEGGEPADHLLGSVDAPVTVIVYADFQ
jgi:hypothetical protein